MRRNSKVFNDRKVKVIKYLTILNFTFFSLEASNGVI